MATILQRVCWNRSGWTRPSGVTTDSGNPGRHGFGNEEWNFCTQDVFRGNIFGWLHWSAKRFEGEYFDILFWAKSPTKEWLLVGAYHDASLATAEDLRELDLFFAKKGVNKRRFSEALDAVPRVEQKERLKQHPPARADRLKFKCPRDKAEIFDPYRLYRSMPKRFRSENARFGKPTIFDEPIKALLGSVAGKRGPDFPSFDCAPQPLLEDVYQRATAASLKIIRPRHKELCNQFVGWLQQTGRKVLGREKDRVDVEFRDGPNFCRAELKVCYGTTPRFAIREALGQLLEYNYYGWRSSSDRWFIVLDSLPSEHDVRYVRTLTSKRRLPLVLCWRSDDGSKTHFNSMTR
jgi:hypothetical protein